MFHHAHHLGPARLKLSVVNFSTSTCLPIALWPGHAARASILIDHDDACPSARSPRRNSVLQQPRVPWSADTWRGAAMITSVKRPGSRVRPPDGRGLPIRIIVSGRCETAPTDSTPASELPSPPLLDEIPAGIVIAISATPAARFRRSAGLRLEARPNLLNLRQRPIMSPAPITSTKPSAISPSDEHRSRRARRYLAAASRFAQGLYQIPFHRFQTGASAHATLLLATPAPRTPAPASSGQCRPSVPDNPDECAAGRVRRPILAQSSRSGHDAKHQPLDQQLRRMRPCKKRPARHVPRSPFGGRLRARAKLATFTQQ